MPTSYNHNLTNELLLNNLHAPTLNSRELSREACDRLGEMQGE